MQLQPRHLSYVPTLCTRASEMRGLEKLPGPTKDRIQPLFLLAPWQNANLLNATVKKIEAAFPGRPYILDIDRYYKSERETYAVEEFQALKDETDAYRKWTDFVAEHPNASPAVQYARLTSITLAASGPAGHGDNGNPVITGALIENCVRASDYEFVIERLGVKANLAL